MKKILVFFMLAVTLITYVQGVTISSSYISDITLDGVPAVIENTHFFHLKKKRSFSYMPIKDYKRFTGNHLIPLSALLP